MRKILFAIIIISSISSIKAQNAKFDKATILEEISTSQDYLKSIIDLGTLDDAPIKFSSVIPLEPEPINLVQSKIDFNDVKLKFGNLKWTQQVENDETTITIKSNELKEYLNNNNISIESVSLENISLFNKGKVTKKLVEKYPYYDIEFKLNIGRKRIKSFDLKLVLESEEYTDFEVDQQKKNLDLLQIEDIQMFEKSVSFIKKGDDIDFTFYAIDEKGLFYDPIGRSSMTKFSAEEIEYYETVLLFLEDAKTALKTKNFKNKKAFEKYVSLNQPEEPYFSEEEKSKIYHFDFAITPKKILFRQINKTIDTELSVPFPDQSKENIYIAESNFDKGLIDKDGNWIVEPIYSYLSKNKKYSAYYANSDETIWISPDNKEVIKYDFSIPNDNNANSMIIEKRYKTGEYSTTIGKGLFDFMNKKMILEPEQYLYINSYHSYYKIKKRIEDEGKIDIELKALYDSKGNLLFDFEEQDIDIRANKLFEISKNEQVYLYKLDSINHKVNLISTRNYSSINVPHYNTSAEDLDEKSLLQANKKDGGIRDYLTMNGGIAIDGEKYNKVRKSYDRFIVEDKQGIYSILDKYGKLIKTLDAHIIPKTEYSANLLQAKDKKTGLYGYLNKKGELVIPFLYSTATRFTKSRGENFATAYVSIIDKEGNKTSFQIDKNNTVVGEKEFEEKGEEIEVEHFINTY